MNKELIEKYYRNTCSEKELIAVLAWFEESAESTDGKSFLFNTWEEMTDEDEKQTTDLDHILNRIHHQINLKKTENLLCDEPQEINRYKKREYLIKFFTRAAAIFLIQAGSGEGTGSISHWERIT